MTTPPNRSPQILVVDDEPFIAQLVADMLSVEGYAVDTAANGLVALEQIRRRSYDLILSDLRMPQLDGLALYRELARQRPELLLRIIFVSGTIDDPEYQKFLEDTGASVLPKPFNLEELRQLAERVLRP